MMDGGDLHTILNTQSVLPLDFDPDSLLRDENSLDDNFMAWLNATLQDDLPTPSSSASSAPAESAPALLPQADAAVPAAHIPSPFRVAELPVSDAQGRHEGDRAPAALLQLPGLTLTFPAADAAAAPLAAQPPRGSAPHPARSGAPAYAFTATAPLAAAPPEAKAPPSRFRQRQRAHISELEAQVEAKLAQVRLLDLENQVLKRHTALLESAVQGRDRQMAVIREHGPPRYDSGGNPTGGTASPPTQGEVTIRPCNNLADNPLLHAPASTLLSSASGASDAAAPAASAGDDAADSGGSEAAQGAAAAAAKAYEFQTYDHGALASMAQTARDVDGGAADEASMRARERVCIESIKSSTPEQVRIFWKAFLQELAAELLAGQLGATAASGAPLQSLVAAGATTLTASGGCPIPRVALQRMAALVQREISRMKYLLLLNPVALYHVKAVNMESNEAEAPPVDHWRSVAAQLGLTSQQVQDLTGFHDMFLHHMSRVQKERSRLHARLHQGGAQDQLLGTRPEWSSETEAVEALAANLRREHTIQILLNCFLYGRIINVMQFAKLALYSYPHYPDATALVSVIAGDAHAASAMQPPQLPALASLAAAAGSAARMVAPPPASVGATAVGESVGAAGAGVRPAGGVILPPGLVLAQEAVPPPQQPPLWVAVPNVAAAALTAGAPSSTVWR